MVCHFFRCLFTFHSLLPKAYLHECLYELNRRIRRRMVTKGDVNLDVEDNRSPYDWPQMTDLTIEDIQYSVHLPLVPQAGKWPTGMEESIAGQQVDLSPTDVVRVLNIVVPESRLLSSRERCPFLVHFEVADTGLEGNDARLYASGAPSLGSTVEEALGMNRVTNSAAEQRRRHETADSQIPYQIPPELLDESQIMKRARTGQGVAMETNVGKKRQFPRGGWQSDDQYYHDTENAGYVYANPLDDGRQHEYEQLHRLMQSQQAPPPPIRTPGFMQR
jgi:hypothetical protein